MKPFFFMRKFIVIVLLLSTLSSCTTTKKQYIKKQTAKILNDAVFENQFLGVMVYDPVKKDTLISLNSHKYFLPASTTKIFTLYTALRSLPDKIPALKYRAIKDTLYIQGTGDPTFLHPYFQDSTTLSFLKNYKNIALILNNFESERYGPGWAWEDYEFYFQPERNAFPMYGNVVSITKADTIKITPDYFKNNVIDLSHTKSRADYSNTFYTNFAKKDSIEIPFITDTTLTKNLLEQVLDKKVSIANQFPMGEKSILYSVSSDSVYKRMMEVSDNFLAEQLLVLSSATLSDTLNVEMAQKNILQQQLIGLSEQPRWVDGSGLSRYNLFSPASFIQILDKMYTEEPKERLFNLFPVRGKLTVAEGLDGEGVPYIYAKSGSFGNNYNLSGYLLTNSGKVLIFSFMNNHYRASTEEIKKRMYAFFENLRDHY